MSVRMERERCRREVQEMFELKRAWYVELCRKREEERKEAAERKKMAWEDFISGIPPKTRGPRPRVGRDV